MILRRYLTRQVVSTTSIVLFFLMVLILSGRLIRYFGLAAEGKLDMGFLFVIIGYNLPMFLELILPLAFFVALMLVFGRMYVDQEMAIIQSNGLSKEKFAWLLTPLIVVLFLLEGCISLWAKPWGITQSERIWQQQALSSMLDLVQPKTFINSQDYHLYVGHLDKHKRELQDVVLIQKNPQKDLIITAKRAIQLPTTEDDPVSRLDLYQGQRYEIGVNHLPYHQASFEHYQISFAKPILDHTNVRLESQPSIKLFEQRHHLNFQAELGYRLSLPFLMIFALLLAIPLSQVQPRQGRWFRLLPAVLLFAFSVIAIISLKTAIGKGKIPAISYVWLMLGLLGFAMLINWQPHLRDKLRHHLQRSKVE